MYKHILKIKLLLLNALFTNGKSISWQLPNKRPSENMKQDWVMPGINAAWDIAKSADKMASKQECRVCLRLKKKWLKKTQLGLTENKLQG